MEILAERVIHVMNFWFFLSIGLCLLAAVNVIIYYFSEEDSLLAGVSKVVLAGGLCIATTTMIIGARHTINHPVMEYKVKFTEKIDMEEFLNTYEIVDKEGSIITIRCLEACAPGEETTN